MVPETAPNMPFLGHQIDKRVLIGQAAGKHLPLLTHMVRHAPGRARSHGPAQQASNQNRAGGTPLPPVQTAAAPHVLVANLARMSQELAAAAG